MTAEEVNCMKGGSGEDIGEEDCGDEEREVPKN